MSVDPHAFKHCLSQFATGVVVVTTSFEDVKYGITINSFASLSLTPPLVLFNVKKPSKRHTVFANAPSFVVNILASDQQVLSKHFSSPRYSAWEKIDHYMSAKNQPILNGILAHIECLRAHVFDAGDHSIVVGQVMNLNVEKPKADPLLYFRSHYATSASDIFKGDAL